MRTMVVSLIAIASATALAFAQGDKTPGKPTGPPPVPGARPIEPVPQLRVSGHVYVGEPAPDFELTSSTGREVALSRLRGDWLLLYFVADRKEFAALDDLAGDLKKLGVILTGICKDKPQSLRAMAQREGVPFEMLADATGEISEIYGLYDLERRTSRTGFVVVDRGGIVRLAVQGQVPAHEVLDLTRFTIAGF